MEDAQGPKPSQGEYRLVARVSNYSPIAMAIDFYKFGKEASPVVAFAENSLENSWGWLVPRVEPILHPVLIRADSLGNTALDTVAYGAHGISSLVDSTSSKISQNITSATNGVMNRVVHPVDHFLKDSIVSKPYNYALYLTEAVVDRYLPDESPKIERGPITKTAWLTWRIPHQIFEKIHQIGENAPKEADPMQEAVDLIGFAYQTLDNTVEAGHKVIKRTQEVANEGKDLVIRAPRVARAKVQNATYNALAAVNAAADVLSKQIPSEIALRYNQLKEVGGGDIRVFSSLAQSSSKMLHETSSTIQGYIVQGEKIPLQILSSAYENLQTVTDGLLSMVHWKKSEDIVMGSPDDEEGDDDDEEN